MDDLLAGRPCNTWEELCQFIGGSPSSFKGHLLSLIEKSDPASRRTLRQAYPREVAAWETWRAMAPCTWGELDAAIGSHTAPPTVTFDLPAASRAFTRDELAVALTRLEFRISLTGPVGTVDAVSMADAILKALEEAGRG